MPSVRVAFDRVPSKRVPSKQVPLEQLSLEQVPSEPVLWKQVPSMQFPLEQEQRPSGVVEALRAARNLFVARKFDCVKQT